MRRPWVAVVLLSAVACTAIDCVVLERRYGVFNGGFLASHHVEGGGIAFYLLGSLWLDMAVAALLCAPGLWVARRIRRVGNRTRVLLAALLCLLPVQLATILRFEITRYVGDTLQYEFARGSHFDTRLLGGVVLALACAVGVAAAILLARFLPWRLVAVFARGEPSRRRSLLQGAALVFGAVAMLTATGMVSHGMQGQLERKTTGQLLLLVGEWATDFDRDGYGLVDQPQDRAPFDERLHPYAVDLPANGLDENSLAGDLPAAGDFAAERYGQPRFAQRPDVVLIVLESFRADNLSAMVDGKPVTPVLRRLEREGALHGPAYSHNGFTKESLSHLFSGSLTLAVDSSLIDDFNHNGYVTACISGEDESFGHIAERAGMVRAHHFIDARDDIDRRSYAFSTPGSLTVPWKVVAGNVERFLDRYGDGERPLFAYVNLQDCHYPYYHRAMDDLVAGKSKSRSALRADNVQQVRRTYLNAAANVDRAVGFILDGWTQRRGRRPAFLIVSDHGESLFDGGRLGHGITLCREQTEIVFLVGGLDVACVYPYGLADARSLLRRALTGKSPGPSARVDSEKWVLQYIGSLDAPGALGAAMADGGYAYRFPEDAYAVWGEPAGPRPDLIRLWEQIVLHRAERSRRPDVE